MSLGNLSGEWLAAGRTVLWPRVQEDGTLSLHALGSRGDLGSGFRGILEPSTASPAASLDQVGLVLVPGVAFDRLGGRLGQGGGFYDRLLADLEGAFSVGVAFEAQIVDTLPLEDHDVALDALVTETGLSGRA